MRFILIIPLLLAACTAPGPVPAPTSQASPKPSASAVADVCHQASVTYCAVNPVVTQATIKQTICVRGWTKTIRPPRTYTDQLKLQQMKIEGLTGASSQYEEDHRLPLELGGAPRDSMNLSPEPGASPNPKDRDESIYREMVCSGQLTLTEAQQQFVAKWLAAYPAYKQ